GSTVDPAKALNGTRNDNPNLEYGLSVTDGSFELNGTAIDVYASDTINAVIDRITQSAAGVSATFDVATEKIVLTQKTLGSVPTIAFANDTSGFLAATKLESATPTPGTDNDKEKPLTDVSRFSSVQSGNININGVAIAIDVDVDSLNDVLDRINASGAGVTASFNETTQRVTIVSNDSSQPLILDSGGTGFFPALDISNGTYQPEQGMGGLKGMPQWYAFQFAHAVQDVAEALNNLFKEPESGTVLDSFLKQLRQKIETAIQKSFYSDESRFETQFGVEFDFQDTKKPFFDFSEDDLNRLASSLIHNRNVREIRSLFLGKYNLKGDGLATRLTEALKNADSDLEMTLTDVGLEMTLGGQGSLIDVWA
ncbi:MAG: flagellin hook IN motif-containing protein, partial [Planctomycetota bacterium]